MTKQFFILILIGLLTSDNIFSQAKTLDSLTAHRPATTTGQIDGRLNKLKISECIEDCTDPDKLFSENYSDSTYQLNFGMLLNCCGNDTITYKLKADTLKIKIKYKPAYTFKIVDGYSYKVPYPVGECECDCYFIFDIEIKQLSRRPKYIKVNKTLLKYN